MDQLFESAPVNHRALELKEELIANALEKYNDLLLRGYDEDEAFQLVAGSIGDVQQLFAELGSDDDYSRAYYMQWAREAQEKKAVLTAVSTGLFLLATVVLVISLLCYCYNVKFIYINGQNTNLLGIAIALLICIVPVSLLVYAHKIQPPAQLDYDAGQAAESRKQRRKRLKQIRGSLEGMMWLLIVIFYFIVSFATRAWHITWIIFLGGAAVECLLDALVKIFFPADKE